MPVPLAVGVSPAVPPFPVNLLALNNLTHQAISDLAIIYNVDFDIVAGDGIAQRRMKFHDWIRGF